MEHMNEPEVDSLYFYIKICFVLAIFRSSSVTLSTFRFCNHYRSVFRTFLFFWTEPLYLLNPSSLVPSHISTILLCVTLLWCNTLKIHHAVVIRLHISLFYACAAVCFIHNALVGLLVVSIFPCCNSNTSLSIVLSIKYSAFLFCFETGSYCIVQYGLKLSLKSQRT